MTQTTIDRVKRVLAIQFEGDAKLMTSDTVIEADSLERIEIGIALEDEFGLSAIGDDALLECRTVNDWAALVEKMIGPDDGVEAVDVDRLREDRDERNRLGREG